jgi:hypothetical protein
MLILLFLTNCAKKVIFAGKDTLKMVEELNNLI